MCWLIFAGIRGQRGDPIAMFKIRGYAAEVSRNPTCAQLGTRSERLEVLLFARGGLHEIAVCGEVPDGAEQVGSRLMAHSVPLCANLRHL